MKKPKDALIARLKSILNKKEQEDKNKAPKEKEITRDVLPKMHIPKHNSFSRVFKFKTIPVKDPNGTEIDYDRVPILTFENAAPTLKLKLTDAPKEDNDVTIENTITKFITMFKLFYEGQLTTDLFDDLAWRYMYYSLSDVSLALRYSKMIQLPKYGDRNWEQVKICLQDIFRLHNESSFRSNNGGQVRGYKTSRERGHGKTKTHRNTPY
ncbi:hypothetical protein BGZ46_002310 [Entomortierella lignicola]|nr:hypothetical protein BGZ46_002310 [Entomortierella lignicola]